MPSKSQLTGQSDIWDLSDYFGGDEWRTSFKWYAPLNPLVSYPYSYETLDKYTLRPALSTLNLIPQPSPLEYYTLSPSLRDLTIQSLYRTYQYADNPYTCSGSLQSVAITSIYRTYSTQIEYYKVTPAVQSIVKVVTNINYTCPIEKYQITPSITGIVKS